jgi:glucose-6-phosphate 1-epimerase
MIILRNAAGDEAALSAHGAQLLSWRPAGEQEQIYLSPTSHPAPGVAVRGGAPICFPQFSGRGPLPKHGFVRTQEWQVLAQPVAHGAVSEVRLQLDSTLPGPWDRAFCLVLAARLGPRWLELHLQAANTGRTAWSFTAAIHTYLQVLDVRAVRLGGLQGLAYEDMVDGNTVRTEDLAALAITQETDRVYRGVSQPVTLSGGGMPMRRLSQQGFEDAVVWNPGPDKAARLGDMPAQDWRHMLCVEAGAITQPVELAPGKTWSGLQRIDLA